MYKESGIYCYKNKINGKIYVGQARNLYARYLNFLNINQRYAGQIIENARKKYGVNNFEYSILTHCSVEELNYWESFYVERLNTTTPHGYNMTNGGDSVYTSTKEFKEKQTEKLKKIILNKNNKIDVSKVQYQSNLINVILICPIHGMFKKTPNNILNKETNNLLCPYCVKEKIRQQTEDVFFKKAYEKWGDKYDYSKAIIKHYQSKITVICPIHGEFEVLVHNHISDKENCGGCPKCSELKKHNNFMKKGDEQLRNFIKNKWGDLYSLDKFVYKGDREKVTLICPIHGDFSMTVNNLKNSNGCHKCTKENIYLMKYSGETNEDVFIEESKKIHGEKYDYSKVKYKHQHQKVCIICPEHGEFYQKPNNHLNGNGCPKCGQQYHGRRKTILQYDLNNNFIKEWNNYDEIIQSGLCKTWNHICSCCTGKTPTAYGFIWKHKKEDSIDQPVILQLTKDNVIVKEWKDMTEIHKAKPINSTQHITKCLQGYNKTAGGFVWKYKEKE